jgi:hypothetical protein
MKTVICQSVVISVCIFLAAMGSAVAGWFGADFSAETYQASPQQQVSEGRMFVSNGRVRTEITVRGKPLVEIIDPQKGLAWLLDTTTKTYRERIVPKQADGPQGGSPCQGQVAAKCQLLGEEAVNGRPAEKWRLSVNQQQQLLWFDKQHHFPLQVIIGEKRVMSMRYLEKERIGTRVVERWEATEYTPQGAVLSLQWYDPQLNIAIRQQAANGAIRELRNIRLGKQPDELFVPPADYQRITPR